jgi:uncharacterized protein YgiM (DUF1202 family)
MKKFILLLCLLLLCLTSCGNASDQSNFNTSVDNTVDNTNVTPTSNSTIVPDVASATETELNISKDNTINQNISQQSTENDYINLGDVPGDNGLLINAGQNIYVVGCDESISLRSEPSTSADVIMQVPLCASITFLADMQNGFCKVSYLNNIGFVLTQYLSGYEPQIASGFFEVVNCKEDISLRTSASTSAYTICKIPLGAKVVNCVNTARNGFNLISYDGKTGWALSEYLQDIGN